MPVYWISMEPPPMVIRPRTVLATFTPRPITFAEEMAWSAPVYNNTTSWLRQAVSLWHRPVLKVRFPNDELVWMVPMGFAMVTIVPLIIIALFGR